MKTLFIVLLVLFCTCSIRAQQTKTQKPALKIENLYNWPRVTDLANISGDGKYVFYTVDNVPKGESTLYITNIAKTWGKSMVNASQAAFSLNSRFISGFDGDGQFFTISLGTDQIEKIPNATDFKYLELNKEEYLVYLIKDKKELRIRNLKVGNEEVYTNVESYKLSPDQDKMILVSKAVEGNSSTQHLILLDLKTKRTRLILKDVGTVDNYTFTFNKNGDRLAFLTSKELVDKTQQKTLWMYNLKDNRVLEVMNNNDLKDWKDFSISGINGITNNGDYIFLDLKRPMPEIKKGVDVYSYTDTIPLSAQIANINGVGNGGVPELSFVIKIEVDKRKVTRITYDNESFNKINNDYGLISLFQNGRVTRKIFYLTVLSTGERRQLPYEPANNELLSLDEKKILLKSRGMIGKGGDNIFSYDLATGLTYNLTADIPPPFVYNMNFCNVSRFKFLAFLEGGNDILVSDAFDIWRIDIDGKKKAINVTNGFGGKSSIGLELAEMYVLVGSGNIIPLAQQSNIILKSSNYKNKDNDFYSISLLKNVKDPKRLTDGGWAYEATVLKNSIFNGTISLKKSKDAYLFVKGNVNHAPNYFVTKDFKAITPISNVTPERSFNWLTNELISYKDLKGKECQGILYKPENFDSNKKYPVLLYYYSTLSQTLNEYLIPELQNAVPNIPFYVSNEYLVFIPDIASGKFDYQHGASYEDALNSVEGAAEYLSKLPYVNAEKVAISGHSHGGGETNYIITHSKRYAAAYTGSGLADMIGSYGVPTYTGDSKFSMGYFYPDFFKERQRFIENTPKLYADKVTTPLLLMHNKGDGAVLFTEGLSFFNTLWKLGKRAWLLQYDNEDHTIENEANQLDFTIRMKQFFDHYLKDTPAPIWMTRGIRATKKGIEHGYELDREIKTPRTISVDN